MSDQTNTNQDADSPEEAALFAQDSVLPVTDELTALKQRADLMGLSYHPSIGVDKLRAKISDALSGNTTPAAPAAPAIDQVLPSGDVPVNPVVPANLVATENPDNESVTFKIKETPEQKRQRLRREANEQVRIRVTCMNPAKKEWQGEIFTVGNNAVGTLKKYVPFNADEGWHVPRMILNMMQERQCQIFVNEKTKNGVTVRRGKQIKEFAIEILPPLTQEELNELARRQALAAGQE